MEIDVLKIVVIIAEMEVAVSFSILHVAEIPSGPAAFKTSSWDSMSKILYSEQKSESSQGWGGSLSKSSLDKAGIENLKFFANW